MNAAVILVAPRVAALLVLGGAALVLARRRDDIGVLALRLRTWAAIAVLFLGLLALGPFGVVALAVGCGLVAALEYGGLVRASRPSRAVLALAGAALPAATVAGGTIWLVALVAALLLCSVPPLVRQDVAGGWDELARTVLGVLWIGGACSALAVLPVPLVLLLGTATALADIGAFVAGKAVGRHALAPRLSPAKTWEGLAGAAVGACGGALLVVDATPFAAWVALPVGVGLAAAATWGDLVESLVKRNVAVKDAGGWLPGFGGLLDRVDSLLVAAPVGWAALTLARVVGATP